MVKYPAENVPLPRRDGLSASILNLSVGQSFLIPDEETTKNTRKTAHAAAKRLGRPVSIRKAEGGLRVFRVAQWPRVRSQKPQDEPEEVQGWKEPEVDTSGDWGA